MFQNHIQTWYQRADFSQWSTDHQSVGTFCDRYRHQGLKNFKPNLKFLQCWRSWRPFSKVWFQSLFPLVIYPLFWTRTNFWTFFSIYSFFISDMPFFLQSFLSDNVSHHDWVTLPQLSCNLRTHRICHVPVSERYYHRSTPLKFRYKGGGRAVGKNLLKVNTFSNSPLLLSIWDLQEVS